VLKDRARRGERGLSNPEIRPITHYDRNQVVRLMLELRAENPDTRLEGEGRSARYSVECARK
jgi:ATP-dependent DNA helicase RecG